MDAPAPAGSKAIMIGYSQSHAYVQTRSADCVLQEDGVARKLMLHTCEAQKGFSGAPILIESAGELRIAGIQVAAFRAAEVKRMLAIPAEAFEGLKEPVSVRKSQEAADEEGVCSANEKWSLQPRNIHRFFNRSLIAATALIGLEETSAGPPSKEVDTK
jgi:hypothetical protein